ncbi:MAG: hypothetical protein ACK5OC_28390 [Pirellula sp.]|jgi:hypothetical protein
MELTFFNHKKRRAYRSAPASGPARHLIGGSGEAVLYQSRLSVSFDLLVSLDLTDPALDLEISPNVGRLPLVYGIAYVGNHGAQRYNVLSDGTVKIADENALAPDGEHVPSNKEERGIELVDCKFDLSRAEDALSMLQVFGLDDLSEREIERALKIAYSGRYALDVYEDWIVYKDLTKKQYLEFWGAPPFWQPGGISTSCSNEICDGQNVRVFATCDIGSLLVIYRHCPDCQSILVSNQA